MGTRSATIVRQVTVDWDGSQTYDELFRFYRHWDGYPSGHGMDLVDACKAANNDSGINNRNWCQHVMAHLFAKDADMEVETKDVEHGDLDYLYVLTGHYDGSGGKVPVSRFALIISVYSMGWDESYEDAMRDNLLFSGTPETFEAWVNDGER